MLESTLYNMEDTFYMGSHTNVECFPCGRTHVRRMRCSIYRASPYFICRVTLPGIERIHARVQQQCKFIGTKESVNIRKELNSHRIGLVHQHGRRFIVLEHQYGCHDVMCIRSIAVIVRET